MPLEVPTYVNDLVVTNPAATDPSGAGDDHLRNLKTALKNTFPNATKAFYFPTTQAKTANFSVVAADLMKTFLVSASGGAVTATLPAAATAGAGFCAGIKKTDSTANAVTIDGSGAETIDGAATKALSAQYNSVWLYCDGAAWHIVSDLTAFGTMAAQNASAVAITGGTITGITDLAIADGGTGSSTAAGARSNLGVTATGADTTYAFRGNNLSDLSNAATARTNLGLGTIATQASSSVSITGGAISGITDLAVADGGTGASTAADARTNLGLGTAALKNTGTSGDAVPLLNAANTWSATQTMSSNLNVAGTVDTNRLDVGPSVAEFTNNSGSAATFNRSTDNGIVVSLQRSTTTVGSISVTTTATSFNETSDGRLKTNRRALEDIDAILAALEPIRFRWTVDDSEGVGFVAQDLYVVVPEAVTPGSAAGPGEEDFEPWQADSGKLMPYVVAGIKNLLTRVGELEKSR